jgi:superfamily I DNA/RNA helicase
MAIMELRVFGPPGTGKTTHLKGRIEKAVELVGADRVLVSSFTRAAAREIASRGIPVDRGNVGTLHSIMYRAIGHPDLAETHIDEWNKDNPTYLIGEQKRGNGESALDEAAHERAAGQNIGDVCINAMNRYRAQMIPEDAWQADIALFAERWNDWKQSNDFLDFTDLIEIGLHDYKAAPGSPSIGFFDEAQDFSKLQMTTIRQWAKEMDYVMFVGDEDQMLYDFTGATTDSLLEPPIPEKQKTILAQSYRVPATIHRIAEKWIKQIKKREPKEYRPRDFEGAIDESNATYIKPEGLLDSISAVIDSGKTAMILASCGYMLNDTIKIFRKEGIPFWNPYRKTRGDWNPLRRSGKATTSSMDRLLAFLCPSGVSPMDFPPKWSEIDLAKWIDPLQSKGILKPKAKEIIVRWKDNAIHMPEDNENYFREMCKLFEPATAQVLMKMLETEISAKWFLDNLLGSKIAPFEFPARVVNRCGVEAVQEPPRVIVGTIHSVKGGESDHVFLFPDLSFAGAREMNSGQKGQEAIIRQFYVGITRCRESLTLCAPCSSFGVRVI